MKFWILASCCSLFISAAYTAFHYDATVRNSPHFYSLNDSFYEIMLIPDVFQSVYIDVKLEQDYRSQ